VHKAGKAGKKDDNQGNISAKVKRRKPSARKGAQKLTKKKRLRTNKGGEKKLSRPVLRTKKKKANWGIKEGEEVALGGGSERGDTSRPGSTKEKKKKKKKKDEEKTKVKIFLLGSEPMKKERKTKIIHPLPKKIGVLQNSTRGRVGGLHKRKGGKIPVLYWGFFF